MVVRYSWLVVRYGWLVVRYDWLVVRYGWLVGWLEGGGMGNRFGMVHYYFTFYCLKGCNVMIIE